MTGIPHDTPTVIDAGRPDVAIPLPRPATFWRSTPRR